ncbi:hypothetical protein [Armatimonas sp.]|uniref:hypothetical protein n=1 Tax=Armatimonas sp. TaxID=1872638 RepID=UPI00375391D2
MKTEILIEPLSDNRWRATGLQFLTISGEGKTRDEAIHNFQLAAVRQISRGTSVETVELDTGSEERERKALWQVAVRIYQTRIKSQVEPQCLGQFVVIDPTSGDFEVDRDDLLAEDRLLERHPSAFPVLLTIGQDHAFAL